MDNLREIAPFLVGMLLPPLTLGLTRARLSDRARFAAAFVPALILGVCTSALAGELFGGMPDGVIAVLIDTSLAYTGSQLAYLFAWKPAVDARREGRAAAAPRDEASIKKGAV